MPYKVFLVEDEMVTREGIRDSMDWSASGFHFCGEAPDGEVALALIEETQPDLIITDIKMPFMDGLQLCKIIREHMPWVKIIILSGYDDFSYAQTAIQLGVSEFLLKPVGVEDLTRVLKRMAGLLDQEQKERENLKRLRNQVEDNLALLKEKYLLRLVMGGESSATAIEQSQQYGLELLARYYLVILIKIKNGQESPSGGLDYETSRQVEDLATSLVSKNKDALLAKKDFDELVLIVKGESAEEIRQEGAFLAGLICQEVESKIGCKLMVGQGDPQRRLSDLHYSFAQALVKMQAEPGEVETALLMSDSGQELRKLDQSALQRFLETGLAEDFDTFFEAYVQPLGETALRSQLYKYYILLDIVLSSAQFISNLGGNVDQVIPERLKLEEFLAKLNTIDHIRNETRTIFLRVLDFRDQLTNNGRAALIKQARDYIEEHYQNTDLSLNEVAAQVNFSPNHFSTVFGQETGVTFKDYLTQVRVEQAQRLLRTTRLKCSEVAFQCGYNDPHYFSLIFRRHTGSTPQHYRDSSKKKKG